MAIQMRRGNRADLDVSRLVVGEFAVCNDGYIYLKINGSQVVQIATSESLEQVISTCQGYVEDCEDYMEQSMYTYFAYSANADGTGMTPRPQADSRYIGIYNGHSSTRPTDKTLYIWSEFIIALDIQGSSFNINTTDGHLYIVTGN